METPKYNLVIDTREQKPLGFRKFVSKKLDFGDYGAEINGHLLPLVFERKSPSDLWATITSGHVRFKKEMERCMDSGYELIVITECSYSDFIMKKFDGSHNIRMRHGIIEKILHKMQVRYNLPFVFVNDRSEACKYIRNTFNALAEEHKIAL